VCGVLQARSVLRCVKSVSRHDTLTLTRFAARCRANGLRVEEVLTQLRRGEQRTSAYRALNPLGKARASAATRFPHTQNASAERNAPLCPRSQVPALQEGDWVLPESCAILRYLCNSRRSVPDHWHALLVCCLRKRRWLL
jgi:hypothetical protein